MVVPLDIAQGRALSKPPDRPSSVEGIFQTALVDRVRPHLLLTPSVSIHQLSQFHLATGTRSGFSKCDAALGWNLTIACISAAFVVERVCITDRPRIDSYFLTEPYTWSIQQLLGFLQKVATMASRQLARKGFPRTFALGAVRSR